MQRGLILKTDVDGVVLAGGVELHAVHDLAFHLFHVVDRASGIAADGGFAAAGDHGRRERGQLAASAGLFVLAGFLLGLGVEAEAGLGDAGCGALLSRATRRDCS